MVNILNISNSDIVGEAFNNFALRENFEKFGVKHSFLVNEKKSTDTNVHQLFGDFTAKVNLRVGQILNKYTGYQNRLNVWTSHDRISKITSDINLLHFQLIQNGWFNLQTAFLLMNSYPSIWSFHDLWPVTGHCVQPLSCGNWLNKCSPCPDLSRPFEVKIDNASLQQKFKIEQIEKSPVQIHVSTNWTLKQLELISPIIAKKTRVIPFGVTIPQQGCSRKDIRSKYGISESDKVILLRGTGGDYKSIIPLRNTLNRAQELTKKIVLIDLDSAGYFSETPFKNIIKLGWMDRPDLFDLVRASDVVIVPSSAETFGLLVAEAQLCGIPVLVQKNTACAEVAGSEETSFHFAGKSMDFDIFNFLKLMLSESDSLNKIGIAGKNWAVSRYSPEKYTMEMSQYYQDVILRPINEY